MPKQLIVTLIVLFFVTLLTITLLAKGCSPMPTLEKKQIIYPTRPVTMIVPSGVGGGMDLQARSIEALAQKHLGKPLIVVNKAGGASVIGWNELVESNADGYTLGISSISLIINPLYSDLKYHYPTALDPIAQFSSYPFIITVNNSAPWRNLDELIQDIKYNNISIKFGHPGITSLPHIVGKIFEKETEATFNFVPFKGGGEVVSSLLGGHIQIAALNPSVVKEQIRAGTLRALATTGEKRLVSPELSNIPTLKEKGVNVILNNWNGVASPKPLPPEVKEKLDKGFAQIVADPDFKRNMDNLGLEVDYLNAADSQKKWIDESHKLKKWLNETGILEQIEKEKEKG